MSVPSERSVAPLFQQMQRPHLVAPSSDEISRYDQIFNAVKDQPDTLSGGCAKSRWETFALPEDILMKIWTLSDQRRRGVLDIGEHRIAMHLIQTARKGGELPASVPPALLSAAIQAKPPLPLSSALPAATPVPPVAGSPWILSESDVTLYKQMFASADSAGKGRVTAATSQLTRSGLQSPTLMQIWRLADVNSDDHLDVHEYVLACHIITRHLKLKLPLPAALPPELLSSAVALVSPTPIASLASSLQLQPSMASSSAAVPPANLASASSTTPTPNFMRPMSALLPTSTMEAPSISSAPPSACLAPPNACTVPPCAAPSNACTIPSLASPVELAPIAAPSSGPAWASNGGLGGFGGTEGPALSGCGLPPINASAGASTGTSRGASGDASGGHEQLLMSLSKLPPGFAMTSIPRMALLDVLRLAAESCLLSALPDSSAQHGAAWAAVFAEGPVLSPSEFAAICRKLDEMLRTGVLPVLQPSNASVAATAAIESSSASSSSCSTVLTAQEQPRWSVSAPPPPPPGPAPQGSDVAPSPPYTLEEETQYKRIFQSIAGGAHVNRKQVYETLAKAKLPQHEVDVIWALCDLDTDGYLDGEELVLALHLAAARFKGAPLPESLPPLWLSSVKRQLLAEPCPTDAGGGGTGGNVLDDNASDVSDELREKKKKSIFGFGGRSRSSSKQSDKGMWPPQDSQASAWPPPESQPTRASSSSSFGGLTGLGGGPPDTQSVSGAAGGDDLSSASVAGGTVTASVSDSWSSSGAQKLQVRLPGTIPPSVPKLDALHAQVDPTSISRSGQLVSDLGGKKKPRWAVLGGGCLAIYADKKDYTEAKPPKASIDMRRDVSSVDCKTMSSFSIVMLIELKDVSAKGKGKPLAKAGESLSFTMDDSKELTQWVNDLSSVWRASQPH